MPLDAFVTFENELSINLAVEHQDVNIFGSVVEFKETLQPTDIIWEHPNSLIVKSERKWRIGGLLFYIAILLMVNFCI